MLKSGHAIKQLLLENKPLKERLIISPILNWDEQLQDGSGSVDLRLGSSFRVPKRSQLLSRDPLDHKYEVEKGQFAEVIYVELGDYFILHPGQFALGLTLEWVRLPKNLGAFITGRSTWGRDGLVIETAAGVHPGYSGNLTLELTNVGEVPVILYPGLAYAQLFIFDVDQKEDVQGDLSAFLATTMPTSGTINEQALEVIKKLKQLKETRYT